MNPVFLSRDFRNEFFSKCYLKAGSLGEIGKEIGYGKRPGLNGTIRDMWLGLTAIPANRLAALSALAGVSVEEVLQHQVTRERCVIIEDWRESLGKYLSNRHDF